MYEPENIENYADDARDQDAEEHKADLAHVHPVEPGIHQREDLEDFCLISIESSPRREEKGQGWLTYTNSRCHR